MLNRSCAEWEVTPIQTSDGKSCDLRLLSFDEKAINNAAMVKHFKCARREAVGARADECLRRSTIATPTPASANSPANINLVGPAPAITTACLVVTACAVIATPGSG